MNDDDKEDDSIEENDNFEKNGIIEKNDNYEENDNIENAAVPPANRVDQIDSPVLKNFC